MLEQSFERPNIPGKEADFPPLNLLPEIDGARKADSRAIAQGSAHQANAAGYAQIKSIELTDPYKEKSQESVLKKSAEDLSEKKADRIERRYDNANLTAAVAASAKSGLPLVVAVGESWCPHCQNMETKVWTEVEGTEGKEGSLQGKAIFLHLDFDQSESLKGEAGKLAAGFRKGIEGFPTIRVYNAQADGKLHFKAENIGEAPKADLEKFLKAKGVN